MTNTGTPAPAAPLAALLALAASLGLNVWTAGRNQLASEGTRAVRTEAGAVVAVIGTDDQLRTGLDRAARVVPAELAEAYLLAVTDRRHRSPLGRRVLLVELARRAGVQLAG